MYKPLMAATVMLTALASIPGARAQAQSDAQAAQVIADARKALGGEKKLAGLKALSMKAEYRREMSAPGGAPGGAMTIVMMGGPGGAAGGPGAQATGEIEIDVAFPDKYFRQDTGTGAMAMTRIEGFEGDRPFIDLAGNSPGMRVTVDKPTGDPVRTKAALKRSNTELARLMLGLVAGTQPGFPVAYTYAGRAESPDGTAHMIDVKGPEDFKVRLFIDTATNQPLMITYMEPEMRPVRMMTRGPGSPGGPGGNTVATPQGTATTTGGAPAVTTPPAGGSTGGAASASGSSAAGSPPQLTPEQQAEIDRLRKEAAATPAKLIEHRIYFADYREVDGVTLPHRITRAAAEKTSEEWEIKSYKVNPTIKADRFKVGIE